MGKMLEKYKDISSADFKENGSLSTRAEIATSQNAPRNDNVGGVVCNDTERRNPCNDNVEGVVCNDTEQRKSHNNRSNKKNFNSLSERWFCYWANKRIDKLKRKVLANNKKNKA